MTNRPLAFAQLAHSVAGRILPERPIGSHPSATPSLDYWPACLSKEYFARDYRTAPEMLEASDGLRSALGMRRVPDYSTLGPFAHDKVAPEAVAQALNGL